MLKKCLSLLLIGLLASASAARPVSAAPVMNHDDPPVEKIKRSIDKLGVGEKAHASVRLKDGTKVKGYIQQTGENDFVIANARTGQKTTVAYSDVKRLEGRNLSTGAKIAIGVSIAVVTVLVIIGIDIARNGLVRF